MLLNEFGSIEKIYEHLENKKLKIKNLRPAKPGMVGPNDNVKIKERTQKLLIENKNMAYLSKKLATIKTDVEFEFKLSDAKIHDFDEGKPH